MPKSKKKILFVASSGGHWEELICLKEIAVNHNSIFVTEKVDQEKNAEFDKMYLFTQINRKEKLFPFHFLWVVIRAFLIIIYEKPDVIITTGALISYPFCLIAKLARKKVIFIESFARVSDASLTGKLVSPYADLFIVQWETMLEVYPKAVYTGGIF